MSLDNNVIVSVSSDAPPIPSAGFGTPALVALPGSLGVGFTERLRVYGSITAVNADITSGVLGAGPGAALTAAFSQTPRTSQFMVIRSDEGADPQAINILIAGVLVDGQVVTLTIGGISVSYVVDVTGGDDADAVALALRGLLTAAIAALNATVGGAGANITVTADSTTDFFSYSATATGTATATVTVTETGFDLAATLSAAAALSAAWYAYTLESRADDHQAAASVWSEANKRRFMGQSSTPDIFDAAVTDDVMSTMQAANYVWSSCMYYSDDSKWAALSWLATKLEPNPDLRTTNWPYATLEGIPADTISATQKAALEGKNCNFYGTFGSRGATWRGLVANGDPIDKRITIDWVSARTSEAIKNLFLREGNANRKIPANAQGAAQMVSQIDAVGAVGEAAGHFDEGTFLVEMPSAAQIAAAKLTRDLPIPFSAVLSGAIEKANISGYVTDIPFNA